jgi:hypothetical protein
MRQEFQEQVGMVAEQTQLLQQVIMPLQIVEVAEEVALEVDLPLDMLEALVVLVS